jgi:hypothetical protein
MTKIISVVIIIAVLWGGWELFLYWDKVKHEEETSKKQAAATVVTEESLPGLSYQQQQTLLEARKKGAAGLKSWLKANGASIQDPRKAWIELDYCLLITRSDPAEAKKIFAEVKQRTPPSSPIWPRIAELEKTYQ